MNRSKAEQHQRVLRLVRRLTPAQLDGLRGRLDPDDLALLDEVLTTVTGDLNTIFDQLGYTPHDGPQTELHQLAPMSLGGPFDVLYGGAMGGGKTLGLLMDACARCLQYPGIKLWFGRSTYTELQRDVLPSLEERGFYRGLGAKWNGSEFTLRWPNTSRLTLIHARSVADTSRIRGETQGLYLDENSQMDPKAVDQLIVRLRSSDPDIPVIGVRRGTNPGGVGHNDLKTGFIDPAPQGRALLPILSPSTGEPVLKADGTPRTKYFLPSTSNDNPSLDPDYYSVFDMMSPAAKAAYRDGDWSQFEGMRFAGFNPKTHIIDPAMFPVDELIGYEHALGVDYGSSAPFAVVWGAKVRSDLIVVYREWQQTGLTPKQQAETILGLEMLGERTETTVTWLDPSTWARNPAQPTAPRSATAPPAGSIAWHYQNNGVKVRKAHNDRTTGWAILDQLLATSEEDGGEPQLLIFNTCPGLIRSITGAPRSDTNPEDVHPNYTDDHVLDAARYLIMGLVGAPKAKPRTLTKAGSRIAQTVVSPR